MMTSSGNLSFVSLENARPTDRKDLLLELELMKSLKPHPHVIKLLGCVTETGTDFVDLSISTPLQTQS